MHTPADLDQNRVVNPTAIPMEYVHCDLCGSMEHKLVCRKRSGFRQLTFSICQCKSCSLTFVNPRLPETMVNEVYSDAYYEGLGVDSSFRGRTEDKAVDAELLVRCMEEILGKKSIALLDVGGGAGLVTEAALRRGHTAELSDLSEAAIKRAQAKGIPATLAKPEEIAACRPCGFDAVVALEVVEHVYEPGKFFAAINRLLKPGGLFVFTTGNVGEALWRGSNWGYFAIPEAHLYFFSDATMDRYLVESGFTRRIGTYDFYFKRWWGVRLLERLGVVDLSSEIRPRSPWHRSAMQLFQVIEKVAGRRRFAWAIK